MNTPREISDKEKLLARVTAPLNRLLEDLIMLNYSDDEAANAIAYSLPRSIAMAVIERGKEVV